MRATLAALTLVAASAVGACSVLAPPTPTVPPVVPTATRLAPSDAIAPVAGPPTAGIWWDSPPGETTWTAPTQAPPALSTPVPTPPSATVASPRGELATALANPPPKRDIADLARRYRVGAGTPTPLAAAPTPPARVGDAHDFWVADSARRRYFRARARLALTSDHVDFYVQEGEQIDEVGARRSLDTFETQIVPTISRDFGGRRINLDRLRLTILNVRLPGVVGYYSSVDEYPRWAMPYSNERPLIGMSLLSVRPGSRGYDSGLAHEFEHLVQWRLDPGEDTWVNEGTAELAIRVVGLDASGNYNAFLQRPDTQLNDWAEQVADTPAHYGAADLFFHYLSNRFGGYSVVGEILARPERGSPAIDEVLRGRATGDQPASFDAAFLDWAIANWANQAAPTEPRFGYPDLPQLRARDEGLAAVPTEVVGSLHQYAARYFVLPKDAAGATLTLKLPATTPLVAAPSRPSPIWWSNRGDNADGRLTRALDLSRVSRAALRFSAWYDLERDFDYGYVAVSTDDGRSWRTLRGRHTNTGDPNGANLGAGLTGRSDGWVDEEMDLTPFAGRRILVRFEVVTDDAYNGGGLCLDEIRVDEIGWRDDGLDGGWQAEGFVRIRNQVPQNVDASVIGLFGHEVRVYPVGMGADGLGRLVVPAEVAAADRAAVLVAPRTPLTNLPADFALRIDRAP